MRRAILALALLTALLATSASAELTQRGDLFVRFDGGIFPKEQPRHTLASIGVGIESRIRVPAGQEPPALRRIRIARNRTELVPIAASWCWGLHFPARAPAGTLSFVEGAFFEELGCSLLSSA